MAMNPRLLVPRASYDPDAARYLAAVEAADGQALETPVKTAIDAFFRGLKATPGLFDAIKASCILCGARTLAGALVPVIGDAPTNVANGFVEGDYSRTAGLTGDAATTYLDSNRANDADGQDDHHLAAYVTSGSVTAGEYLVGTTDSADPTFSLAGYRVYSRSLGAEGSLGGGAGLYAVTRGASDTLVFVQASASVTSVEKSSASITISQTSLVFAYRDGAGSAAGFTNETIAFYSIGTDIGSAGLAALDTAVSNLITAIGNAL